MSASRSLNRREWLCGGATAMLTAALSRASTAAPNAPDTKSLAAVVTVYRPFSHADVILTKILEGWRHDGGPGPALKLASLYVDQFPADDLARAKAAMHRIPIFDTIEGAVTAGTSGIPVDGVLSIGEHGDYPWNEKGQQLYPRRRFFDAITSTFEKHGRVVPVFSDKHLPTCSRRSSV